MRLIIGIFGIYMVIAGIVLCFRPKIINCMVSICSSSAKIRIVALIAFSIGALLILASKASNSQLFVNVLGFLSVIKGIYIFLESPDNLLKFINWWVSLPRFAHRIWGVTAASIGVLLLSKI